MATLDNNDLVAIVDSVEFQLEDIDLLVPEGYTLRQLVDKVAPAQLDYINSRLYNVYENQASPLQSQTLTLLTWSCIGEILMLAYRRSAISEKEWADEWANRAEQWIVNLQNGLMGLSAPTKNTGAANHMIGNSRRFAVETIDNFNTITYETVRDLDKLL